MNLVIGVDAMKIKSFTGLLSLTLLVACASTPIEEINNGKATLVEGSVSVNNYFVGEFLIDFKDYGRKRGEIMISDCAKGNGTIKVDASEGRYIPNLIKSGNTKADKLFAEACQKILPLSAKYESERNKANANKSSSERQQDRENIRLLMQMQQSQQMQDNADARNKQLIDAIKDTKPVTTNCTKDGYGNVSCVTK